MGLTIGAAAGTQTKVLSADLGPISATTTLANVTGLFVPIGASATEIWIAKFWLELTAANATMDAKFGFTVPASATMRWGGLGLASEIPSYGARAAANTPSLLNTESGTLSPATAIGTSGVAIIAKIFGGGTAGNVQLQWAQNTSDAGNLTLLKGSMVEYVRLAA